LCNSFGVFLTFASITPTRSPGTARGACSTTRLYKSQGKNLYRLVEAPPPLWHSALTTLREWSIYHSAPKLAVRCSGRAVDAQGARGGHCSFSLSGHPPGVFSGPAIWSEVRTELVSSLLSVSLLSFLLQTPANAGSVALTIDDGPYPDWVEKACAVARKYDAKLTFFVCGQHLQAHPAVAPRLVRLGHEVENHTYNHPVLPALSADMIDWQIRRTGELIFEQTGHRPVFLRPPYGAFGRRTGRVVAAAGHRLALWTIDPKDWSGRGAADIASHVLSRVQDGSVVLLHEKGVTLEALPAILAGCRKRGLRCVTLRELWHVPGYDPDAEQLAPLRALTDDETHVDWDQQSGSAVLRRKDLAIRLRVGDRNAVVNGAPAKLPVAPVLYRGQLYVPDEFIAAALAETLESTEQGQRVANADGSGQGEGGAAPPLSVVTAPPAAIAAESGASPAAVTLTPDEPAFTPPAATADVRPSSPQETPLQQHLRLGQAFKGRREYAAAADEFLAGTRCQPESVEAHWALAWTLAKLNLADWAAKEFARVAQLDRDGDKGSQAARLTARYHSSGRL